MQTALKTDEEKKEYFDSPEVLDQKLNILLKMIMNSKHFIAFTGAGISTSSGIPDYRSGINTVLKTGPGAWEKLAQKLPQEKKNQFTKINMLKAVPSKTHMSLIQLEKLGYLKYLISQNVDGLHRRSGFPVKKLAELHGNTNLEKCKKCKSEYIRDFRCRTAQQVHNHETQRKCEKCDGKLYDSIINFGEDLPENELKNGFHHSKISDLHLVLGSSLRVTPAADMPRLTAELGGKLVIINLQKTPLDDIAALRINAMCDDVMELLMKKLGVEIPQFVLQRRILVKKNDKNSIIIKGIDQDGQNYSFLKSLQVDNGTIKSNISNFIIKNDIFQIKLMFFGHYGESDYDFNLQLSKLQIGEEIKFSIEYYPSRKQWDNFQKY